MILGHELAIQDNNSFMFLDTPSGKCLEYIGDYLDLELPKAFRLYRKRYDLSETYDGYTIASEKFKAFVKANKYKGIEFTKLPVAGFYWIKVHNVLEYDPKRSGTRFLRYNAACNGYKEVIGATPVCLKNNIPVGDNIYRTDLFFGTGMSKGPVYMVGLETSLKMKQLKMAGIGYNIIEDRYDWERKKK